MNDLLSARKLYVDSRFAAAGGTSSSFDFELPEIVELPRDTVAYITEFTAVCGWDTVNESNYKFYIVEQQGPTRAALWNSHGSPTIPRACALSWRRSSMGPGS